MQESTRALLTLGSSVVLGLGLVWFAYRCFWRRKRLGKRAVVKSLYIYPVKSCAGIKLNSVQIEEAGPLLDRVWVLVNSKGIYQNQISVPKLALVKPMFEDGKYLFLNAPGMPTLKLDVHVEEDDSKEKKMVRLFAQTGEGVDCGDEAGEWFDKFLGKTGMRLYNGKNKNLKRRELKGDPVWQDVAQEGDRIIFSNYAPVLLTCEESLVAVNMELNRSPVDMRSFRPSVVVQGCEAFEEETWNTITIGNVLLRKFRNCPRCPLITVDPDSGVTKKDGEPLATLRRTRVGVLKGVDKRLARKPLFGVYFVADQTGPVSVGDDVNVLA